MYNNWFEKIDEGEMTGNVPPWMTYWMEMGSEETICKI